MESRSAKGFPSDFLRKSNPQLLGLGTIFDCDLSYPQLYRNRNVFHYCTSILVEQFL